jgi:type I restriction enzyme S subunit
LADGGAYPAVRPEIVQQTPIVVPDAISLGRFSEVVEPMLSRIGAGRREEDTLADLRDALLPKLISGELRVPDADERVEEAVKTICPAPERRHA